MGCPHLLHCMLCSIRLSRSVHRRASAAAAVIAIWHRFWLAQILAEPHWRLSFKVHCSSSGLPPGAGMSLALIIVTTLYFLCSITLTLMLPYTLISPDAAFSQVSWIPASRLLSTW